MKRNEGLNKDRTTQRVMNAVIGLMIEDLTEVAGLPSESKPRARHPMVSDRPEMIRNTHRLNVFRRSGVNMFDVDSKDKTFIVLKIGPQSFGNQRSKVILRQGGTLVLGNELLFEEPRFKRSRAKQSRSEYSAPNAN